MCTVCRHLLARNVDLSITIRSGSVERRDILSPSRDISILCTVEDKPIPRPDMPSVCPLSNRELIGPVQRVSDPWLSHDARSADCRAV